MSPLAVQNATAMRLTRASRAITRGPAASRAAAAVFLSPSTTNNSSYASPRSQTRGIQTATKWRPVQVLDEWVAKEARPISLRQLMVFGRSLTESRLISSANYVRTELPIRIAHRIRDMQRLPYVVVTNPHISDVYDLYYTAFDTFRRVKEIKTLEDNEQFCREIAAMLKAHLTVIPKLAMGIIECSGLMDQKELDRFMSTILKSRISRRVIAEQHLSLTETFDSDWFSPGAKLAEGDFIGEVFLKCVAKDVIERCGAAVQALARSANGPDVQIPEIRITGHLEASFPYILSHLEYIVGELLRNSVQAVIDHHARGGNRGRRNAVDPTAPPPPIEVTVCEAQKHVIIRVSDQGGGIPRDVLPYLWSFSKGPRSRQRLENLTQVPFMAATMQELRTNDGRNPLPSSPMPAYPSYDDSLTPLSTRPPHLRLGMGLPLSRVYAEYWAGSLELHSLEGYGVDAFLQISKLGNKNEQLATRAAMDSL